MISLSTWLLFVAACVALAITPGPNLLYIVSRTLVQGRPAGFVSLAGTVSGLAFHILAAAFGLSALLVAVPMAYDAVRIAGALYLAWLAWQTWRSATPAAGAVAGREPWWRLWRDGAATGVLNPKVALFQLALFPQFVDPAQGGVLAQSLVLGATQLVVLAAIDSVWVLAASRVRGMMGAQPRFAAWSRRMLAGVFGALAARLLVDDRR
jgi:threonine/homoserine/homoserine lactone efflux protein